MERIKLNLIPSGVAPVVHVSQYDDGREFAIDLYEGENVYVLDGTETLTVNVRKPDGHLVVETVTNTSDSYVVIATTEQMTAVHGTNYAKLQIVKGGVTIATLEFLMNVSRDPLENGDPSESFVSNLETQIASAVADQYDSNNVVFDANPTSGHGVGFAVTSEGVKNADDAVVALIPTDLDDLSDVTTSTPLSGEALVWDGSKWTNGTPALDVDDLNDVTITTPTDGEILVYNNGTWENQANPASTANFGPDYDENTTYNTGDKVIYQGLFYVCNDDNVTGTWDATKWDSLTVADLNGKNIPMSTTDPDKVADRIEACETAISGKADTSDTYTKSEVDTLIAGRKCSTFSLVTTSTLTGTETTFNTFSGRKFSDYDLYIFTFGESVTYMRRTALVTKSQWVSGASVSEGVLHGSGSSSASAYSYCGMVISYNNDTSVKGKVLGSEAIDKFSIIGIKY